MGSGELTTGGSVHMFSASPFAAPGRTLATLLIAFACVTAIVSPASASTVDASAASRTSQDPDDLVIKTGDRQSYGGSPYSAYSGMWGVWVPNNESMAFSVEMQVNRATFPDNTRFTWDVTPDPDYPGINGYLHVDYGNYSYSPGTITPRQISTIADLTMDVDWTFTGDERSGLLAECWLTATPAATGPFTATHEIGFLATVGTSSAWWASTRPSVGSGSFIDRNGVRWLVKEAQAGTGQPYYFAYRADSIDHEGALPFSELFAFLIGAGKLTGAEWFNGAAFGVEPQSGAGSLTIDDLDITYTGTENLPSPIQDHEDDEGTDDAEPLPEEPEDEPAGIDPQDGATPGGSTTGGSTTGGATTGGATGGATTGGSAGGAATAGASPVYRFWSSTKSSHFYTISASERDFIIANYDDSEWHYEGPAYHAYKKAVPGAEPLYRFWSSRYQGHFYTADAAERDAVIANYADDEWLFEGIAYYVVPTDAAPGSTSIARFWSEQSRSHFYTADPVERDFVIDSYDDSEWKYEGTAFTVPTD